MPMISIKWTELRPLIGEVFCHSLCQPNFTKSNQSTLQEITTWDPMKIYANFQLKNTIYFHHVHPFSHFTHFKDSECMLRNLDLLVLHLSSLVSSISVTRLPASQFEMPLQKAKSLDLHLALWCEKATFWWEHGKGLWGNSHVDFWNPKKKHVIETKWDFVGGCFHKCLYK